MENTIKKRYGIKCPHNKKKNNCRDCGGTLFCEHNKQKYYCRECGGKGICEHDKTRSTCKLCKGSQICSHNKEKRFCRDCGGSAFCEHGKVKDRCRDCNGTQICEHDKVRSVCKVCNGGSVCCHNKVKNRCRECDGSSFCEHDKRKEHCRLCNGSQICEHDKIRNKCVICTPSSACQECKSVLVNKKTQYYPLCQACFCNAYPDHEKSTLYKIKERHLRDELRLRFSDKDINMIFDKTVNGGCSKKRPDVLIDLLLYSIIIECDEEQHKNYECENKRTMQLFEDLGNRPLIVIRFNPDSYIEKKKKIKGCFKPLIKIEDIHKRKFYDINKKEWKRRIDILEKVIKENIRENIPEKEVEEIRLFYDNL